MLTSPHWTPTSPQPAITIRPRRERPDGRQADLDAVPGLNFLSIRRSKLTAHGWIQILPDHVTPGLAAVVQRRAEHIRAAQGTINRPCNLTGTVRR
jgi:hypothetical protein